MYTTFHRVCATLPSAVMCEPSVAGLSDERTGRSSIEVLLRVGAGSQEKPDNEMIDRLIGDTWWESNDALWESAPMNLLVAGGNLSLITNPRLVQELASLRVAINGVRNLYQKDQKFHQEIMTPFIMSHTNMIQIIFTV